MLLAGCGSKSLRAELKQAPTQVAGTDIALLNHLLDLENLTIAAYTAAIPLLSGEASAIATQFLGQELAHAEGLAGLVKAARGHPHSPALSYDLGHPRDDHDVLQILRVAEDAQLSAYLEAIPQLKPGAVRQAAAGYFANDAQHVSVLRSALGQPLLAGPFVSVQE